ncbi:MAG: hypothetical protein AB8B93_12380 [Pseudomonadales bacterium]
MRLSEFILVGSIVAVVCGCAGPSVQPLVTYEHSGGIAGYAQLVEVSGEGVVAVRDRATTASFQLAENDLITLRATCGELIDTDSGLELSEVEEVECCDQIVERVTFDGKVYELYALDDRLAESLRVRFQEMLKQGLAEDDSVPSSQAVEGANL